MAVCSRRGSPGPQVAIIEFDGGRIRTRKEDCGPGVHLVPRSTLSDRNGATLGVHKLSDLGGGESFGECCASRVVESAHEERAISDRPFETFARCATSWLLIVEPRLQVVNGVDEVAVLDCHGEVDRVEIRLAAKTASKIGAWVHGRLRLTTQRTDEDQLVVSSLVRPTQVSEVAGRS